MSDAEGVLEPTHHAQVPDVEGEVGLGGVGLWGWGGVGVGSGQWD